MSRRSSHFVIATIEFITLKKIKWLITQIKVHFRVLIFHRVLFKFGGLDLRIIGVNISKWRKLTTGWL